MPRIAIFDLGTNTFHLLIADVNENSFTVLFKQEEFVKLGEEGLERIGDNAFARGLEQVKQYKQKIDEYKPERIVGFGTAAIRNASNGEQFMNEVNKICPMELKKISGDEEAELIYLGVRQAVALDNKPVLIMDIGGGSTEFIIADAEKIYWKESFPAGASVLKQKFHHREPIAKEEVHQLVQYFEKALEPLFEQKSNFHLTQLIGASGSFDTLNDMITEQFQLKKDELPWHEITPSHILQINIQLENKNLEQRIAIPGMKAFRAEMMVVATLLIQFVVQQFRIQRILQSGYALKEGALWKMMHSEL